MKSIFGFSLEALDQACHAAHNGIEDPADFSDAIQEGLVLKYKDQYLVAPIAEAPTSDEYSANGFTDMSQWLFALENFLEISKRVSKKSPVFVAEPVMREFGAPEIVSSKQETVDVPWEAAEEPVDFTPAPAEKPKATNPRLELPKCLEELRGTFDDMMAAGTPVALVRQIIARGAGAMELQREEVFVTIVQRYWAAVCDAELTVTDTISKLMERLDDELKGGTDPKVQKLVQSIMEVTPGGMRKRIREQVDRWLDKGMFNSLRYAWDQAAEKGADYPVKYMTSIMEQEEKSRDIEAARQASKMKPEEIRELIEPFMPKINCWDREARIEHLVKEFSTIGVVDAGMLMRIGWDPGGMYTPYVSTSNGEARRKELVNWGYAGSDKDDWDLYRYLAANFGLFWDCAGDVYAHRDTSFHVRTHEQLAKVLDSGIKNLLVWIRDGKTKYCSQASKMKEEHTQRVFPFLLLHPILGESVRWWLENKPEGPLDVEETYENAEAYAERFNVEFTR